MIAFALRFSSFHYRLRFPHRQHQKCSLLSHHYSHKRQQTIDSFIVYNEGEMKLSYHNIKSMTELKFLLKSLFLFNSMNLLRDTWYDISNITFLDNIVSFYITELYYH